MRVRTHVHEIERTETPQISEMLLENQLQGGQLRRDLFQKLSFSVLGALLGWCLMVLAGFRWHQMLVRELYLLGALMQVLALLQNLAL